MTVIHGVSEAKEVGNCPKRLDFDLCHVSAQSAGRPLAALDTGLKNQQVLSCEIKLAD